MPTKAELQQQVNQLQSSMKSVTDGFHALQRAQRVEGSGLLQGLTNDEAFIRGLNQGRQEALQVILDRATDWQYILIDGCTASPSSDCRITVNDDTLVVERRIERCTLDEAAAREVLGLVERWASEGREDRARFLAYQQDGVWVLHRSTYRYSYEWEVFHSVPKGSVQFIGEIELPTEVVRAEVRGG